MWTCPTVQSFRVWPVVQQLAQSLGSPFGSLFGSVGFGPALGWDASDCWREGP